MNITKEFISSVSQNEAALKNGADLVKKKNFKNLAVDKDKTYISGECLGSGKIPYACSVDFINENSPVFRCSCPSRQIPCKHVVGLLWAYMENHSFSISEIPADIISKRENKEERAKKAKEKLEAAEKTEPANKEKSSAWLKSAVKKIEAQLTGIEEAEKILLAIAQSGFGSMDAKSVAGYFAIVKQLDSYFIPGIQSEIYDLLGVVSDNISKKEKSDNFWHAAAEKLCRIYALTYKGREYLEKKKATPDKPDTQSEIEELMGYAWKLEELLQLGLYESDAKLVQLCFHVRQEEDKKRFVDEGFYISLNSGNIYKTRNYRPFKAAKHIKEEDSVFLLLHIPKLYIYPSQSLNPRVRWDGGDFEAITPEICASIFAFAKGDYAEVIKSVKNQLKNLLLFPYPAVLLSFEKIIKAGDGEYVIYDAKNNAISLKKSGYFSESFAYLLDGIDDSKAKNCAMLAVFDNDIKSGELFAQPVALVTDEKIMRLLY